jgi:hypothetical protein
MKRKQRFVTKFTPQIALDRTNGLLPVQDREFNNYKDFIGVFISDTTDICDKVFIINIVTSIVLFRVDIYN